MSEPMGPVHLDLPEDVALAPATEPLPRPTGRIALTPAPDAEISRAAQLIAAAKRPVVVIGSSAMRLTDPSLLRKVVERHGLPFATTTMAKGLIDEEHRLSVGCIERGCRQLQRKFLRSADLILGLGYDTIEVEYEAWIGDVPLLSIDIDPPDVAPSVNLVHHVGGDLDAALARLAALPPATNRWAAQALADHRRTFQQALRPDTNSFSAHAAIDAVRRALPRDGVLSFDVGAHTHQIASQWTAHAPKTFLITNGWSSMGFGLPGAIAAKLARPSLPVVCLIGDGCFQMTCGEVATAKRLGLTLPIVVLDDRWLGLIKVKQIRRQFPLYGTELQEEDYREPPAHYFGVPAIGVRSADALEAAVRSALAAQRPTVIEAVVDSEHYIETVYD
jgi:acetolactate synthase-1/2/3 large subunit